MDRKSKQAKEIADIIEAYVKNNEGNQSMRRGVISVVRSGNKADVKIEGNPVAAKSILCLGSYSPVVGEKVLVASIGGTGANLLILGGIGGETGSSGDPSGEYTFINGSIDFNADRFITGGKYVIRNNANVNASLNRPVNASNAGWLEVKSLNPSSPPVAGAIHSYSMQYWQTLTGQIATRAISTGATGVQSFSAWKYAIT